MTDSATPAPLAHGVARLERAPGRPVGVAVAGDGGGDVRLPGDLPEHRVEMHLFPCARSAWGFAEGLAAAGRNDLHAAAFGQVVLVARLAEDRPAGAASLEDALALVEHGVSRDSLAEDAARAERRRLARESERRERDALLALWGPVREALAGFPPKTAERRGWFPWKVAELDETRLTAESAVVEGTFDPDPPVDGTGSVREFRASLARLADGTVVVSTPYVLNATEQTAAHRMERLAAACAEAGYEFHAPSLRPRRRCAPSELRGALEALPPLWSRLRALAEEASLVQRAADLAAEREIARTLAELAAGRAIRQTTGSEPGRLETARGGRGAPLRLIAALRSEGLIEITEGQPLPGGTEPRLHLAWGITALGRAVLAGDLEAAAAMIAARR